MRVLVACEFSGVVRNAFAIRGHDAWSCDLLPSETPGNHMRCDVLGVLNDGWDMLIAHPPCTRLCNSGVRWLAERSLWDELRRASAFFKALMDCGIPLRCIENPIPHKYATATVGPYSQIVQPWMFGHGESKATCLWLRNLPPLVPTQIVAGRAGRVHREPPSPDRWKRRSVTYAGIANAMAEQWS